MRALVYAARNLRRQPARTVFGLLGIISVGALLLDMLLLSNGLVLSFGKLLDQVGYDVRVTATQAMPSFGARIEEADRLAAELLSLSEVDAVSTLAIFEATVSNPSIDPQETEFWRHSTPATLIGTNGDTRANWTILEGQGLEFSVHDRPIVIDRETARIVNLKIGDDIHLIGHCQSEATMQPRTLFTIAGIADFAFSAQGSAWVAGRLHDVGAACGFTGLRKNSPPAQILLVASAEGVSPDRVIAAIQKIRPDLHAFSNEDFLDRLRTGGYSYFQQISRMLTVITLGFSILLITTLISVAVNQRLGEIAALRALGLSRLRVVADLVAEAIVLTGLGALIAIPVGAVMARWLDGILRDFPDIPARLHFFVWDPKALWLYLGLMTLTTALSVVYPAWLVWRLPIASTLRDEVLT
jgi:putative ABC transport system permease protein